MQKPSWTITIINGDALDPKNYPSGPVTMALFDPAFKDYEPIRAINKGLKIKAWPLNYYQIIAQHLTPLLKPLHYLIYKCDDTTALETYPIFKSYLTHRRLVTWDKGRISTGGNPRIAGEFLQFFYKAEGKKSPFEKKFPPKPPSKWHGNSMGRSYASIQRIYHQNGGEIGKAYKDIFERLHINQTEVELWKKSIDFFCPKDGLVLDICCGSGSIAKAVLDLNKEGATRSFWGIELDPEIYQNTKTALEEIQHEVIQYLCLQRRYQLISKQLRKHCRNPYSIDPKIQAQIHEFKQFYTTLKSQRIKAPVMGE